VDITARRIGTHWSPWWLNLSTFGYWMEIHASGFRDIHTITWMPVVAQLEYVAEGRNATGPETLCAPV
jgi:hypothetical protein